jgi:LysM repeat protein
LLQIITRPEPAPALLNLGQTEPSAVAGGTLNAAVSGPGVQLGPAGGAQLPPPSSATTPDKPREVQASVKAIEPNYTVAAGDTLGQIATRFNTNAERIQALNNLADPRALRIGLRLVIPPPL